MANDSQGSIWRKWDLHLHPPGTKKNNQYGADGDDIWDEFCKRIEESDVQAFGITDYFSGDGYFNFIGQFRAKYPNSSKVFFPNIELCTNDVVNAANEEVNLHIIFDSSNPEMDAKIRLFLQNLKTSKTIAGGRNIKASELSSRQDFEEATTTRSFIEDALKETFGHKVDLTESLLIFTCANNDGIRTETELVDGKRRGKKRKALITDELDKFSDGFFGNATNIGHFLNKDRLEGSEEIEQKPVITGSDAHSLAQLDELLGKVVLKDGAVVKQPTWIKADLTFEGLRQIIFEPECRVFIGEEPEVDILVRNSPRKYIESLYVTSVEGYDGRSGVWFEKEAIPLSKELVAIIGNKGSGKSALTDIIGLLGNSHNQKYQGRSGKPEELFSFLNREKFLKGRCAANFTGEIRWYEGQSDSKTLDADTDQSVPENVEYLPQKYLEKICSNIEDDEFRQKLNEVIFGYVEEKDRYGTESLEDLVDYLGNQTKADLSLAKTALHDENEKVVALEKKLSVDHSKEIKERLRLREEEAGAHNNLKPTVVPAPAHEEEGSRQSAKQISDIETKIATLSESQRLFLAEQSTLSKQTEDLRHLKQEIQRHVGTVSDIEREYDVLLRTLGINFRDILSYTISFENLDAVLQVKTSRLNELEISLRTEDDIEELDPALQDQAREKSLWYQLSSLEIRRRELVDQLDKPNRDYQAYLDAEIKWKARKKELEGDPLTPLPYTVNWLKEELRKISEVYPEELREARSKREIASKATFQKKKALMTFYNSVKHSIDKEIERYSEELGDYDIAIEASLRFETEFYEGFFKFINQALKGSFYGTDEGQALLKDLIGMVNSWENETEVFAALQTIVDHLDSDEREGSSASGSKARDIFKQLKQNKEPVDFYDFLFGFDYLETKYDLKVDEKDLSELSPGERGGLLLIFYLMLDRRDIPLIIDQPEDNLDNKSVYEILVTFLKKAKKRRQIVMVTHNPNLAVVADAEQIIYVSINKKSRNDFDFYAGAIENPRTNKIVVDILEGTLPAFDNRRLKYRKPIRIASAN